jgi:hypothetical protein
MTDDDLQPRKFIKDTCREQAQDMQRLKMKKSASIYSIRTED